MSRQRHLPTLMALAFGVTVSAGAAEPKPAEIDALLADYDNTSSPGCSVGVFREGQLVFAKGYGMASLELGVPNTPQTVFYIGSTSKQFVAASIVLAADEGHLSLDDDIRKHLPELPDYGETITVRNLIHHTSGLRDYLSLMYLAGAPFENVYTDEWVIDLISRQKALNFAPGERYLYSNSGYFLLGQIVDRSTGKTLREYADEKIFEPLGMVHTHFHDNRGLVVRNRAMAYAPGEDGEFRLDWYPNFDKVGSGGLLTTVEDLLLWDRVFYDDPFGDGRFVEQMLERGRLDDGGSFDYAFGLSHGELGSLPTVGHSGGFMGFRAQLLRFPEQRFSVTCLCNIGSADPSTLARQIATLYLADLLAPPELAASDDEAGRDAIEIAETDLQRLAGRYWSAEDSLAREIRVEDGKLMYVRSEKSRNELSPRADGAFLMLDAPVQVEVRFEPADAAQPRRMSVTVANEEPGVFERVEEAAPSADELEAYVGSYSCDELDVGYVIRLVDGSLLLGVGSPGDEGDEGLEPFFGETFMGERGALAFKRAHGGRVTGFRLDAGRVRGLEFVRQTDQ